MNQQLLRQIPKVDELLKEPKLEALLAEMSEKIVTRAVRDGRRNSYGNHDDRGYRGGRDDNRDERGYRGRRDGRNEERHTKEGSRFFGMEKKRGRDEKNSSRQIKTLPQNSGKKKENKISITEYKKRFKF